MPALFVTSGAPLWGWLSYDREISLWEKIFPGSNLCMWSLSTTLGTGPGADCLAAVFCVLSCSRYPYSPVALEDSTLPQVLPCAAVNSAPTWSGCVPWSL